MFDRQVLTKTNEGRRGMIIGKRKKLIIFIIVAIAAVATLICLIMWQSGEESGVILSTIALFACLEVIAVCISFFC